MEVNKLFDEHKEGEHAAIVAKTKLQIESLLRRIEDALETASDELRLDVDPSSCTHSPVKNARESDQQSPVKERVATDVLPFEDVEKILMDEENLNMEMVWKVVDLYKEAIILSKENDMEVEAIQKDRLLLLLVN